MKHPQKLKIELSYDPEVSLLGIYFKKKNENGTCEILVLQCALQHYSQ